MKERRKKNDRRHYIAGKEGSPGNNRRRFPDRRLNSISVEWIPMGLAHAHPITRRVFRFTQRIFKTS
jgi:hypothetical protein